MTLVFRGRRIRVAWSSQRAFATHKNLALAAASLMTPCALIAFTLTCWSAAADMDWTAHFFVARGFLSHWQSWLIASSVLLLVSRVLAQWVDKTNADY